MGRIALLLAALHAVPSARPPAPIEVLVDRTLDGGESRLASSDVVAAVERLAGERSELGPVRVRLFDGCPSLGGALAAFAGGTPVPGARRLAVVVLGEVAGCGPEACAQARSLAGSGFAGLRIVSTAPARPPALDCAASFEPAVDLPGLEAALSAAFADASATTGIAVSHFAGAGEPAAARFSARPVPLAPRRDLLAGAAGPEETYALAPGRWDIRTDEAGVAPRRVLVREGEVTAVATGDGSLVVTLENYWGREIPASVEVSPAGGEAAAEPEPARRPGRFAHTTMPLAPGTPPGESPAQEPGAAGDRPSGPAAPLRLLRTRAGERLDLPAGRYRAVARFAGGVLSAPEVAVEAGRSTTVVLRAGAIRVERGPRSTLAAFSADGAVRVPIPWGGTVDLAPGTWAVRSADGGRELQGGVEVRPGDVTLLELP